jgi:integrase
MASERGRQWAGGYVRTDREGRDTYWIRRKVGGVRYEVSTRCHTDRAAMAELARFEADPAGYQAGGGDPLRLDAEMVAAFMLAQETKPRPPTLKWRAAQRAYLAWWSDVLGGRDLRRVNLGRDILPALRGQGAKHLRIATIKRLYSWLRETDRIAATEDPTFGRLKVPAPEPAQWTRSKVIPVESYTKARSHLVGAYRDALDVLAGTGWHVTELARFAQGGTVEPYRGENPDVAGVLVCPRHKAGGSHRTAVSADVLAAARRLRSHGGLSESRFHRAVLAACDAAGVERFRPGWFRHTIATMATEAGAADQAPAFLGHRSATTTRRFYATRAVPPKIPTLR